jgi:hypothetical protein
MWMHDHLVGLLEHLDLERKTVVQFIPQSRVGF